MPFHARDAFNDSIYDPAEVGAGDDNGDDDDEAERERGGMRPFECKWDRAHSDIEPHDKQPD